MALHFPPQTLKWDISGVEIGFRRELPALIRQLEGFRLKSCESLPPFFSLPDEDIKPIIDVSLSLKRFKHLVVIGVGGSSLGAEALVSLHGGHKEGITFLNNLDPLDCRRVLRDGNPE